MQRLTIFIFCSTLFFSCTPDGQKMSDQAIDSLKAANENDVDTFSVKKSTPLTPEQKLQKTKDSVDANQIISDASVLINQGNPDPADKTGNGTTGVVTNPDVAPSFPGGESALEMYLAKHQQYPLVAFQNEIKGTVQVKFVIESDGSIGGVTVLQGLGYGCDEAAVDLIQRMPKWIPGKKAGANVRCAVILPIYYGQ